MRLEDLQNDPFFIKLLQQIVYLVGMSFQERAAAALTMPMTLSEDGEGENLYAAKMAELFDNEEFFPAFNPERHNYMTKPEGYVCKTPKGNLAYLLEPYDSAANPGEPEDHTDLWGFYWSPNPEHATEFIQSALSPYYNGAYCRYDGELYRSIADVNTSSPADDSSKWEKLTEGETLD